MADRPVLLFDGVCGFCDATVQFVLRRDSGARLRFAPLQGDFARGVLARHPDLDGVDSLVLVEGSGPDEVVRVRSEAALRVARYLGGVWHAARLLRVVPRPLRDAVYDRFARARYSVFGRRDSCRVPAAADRARFID